METRDQLVQTLNIKKQYLVDVFLDLLLVVFEDWHVRHFILLCVFEFVAVLFHETGLHLFELLVHDDLLQGGDHLIEEDFFGG